MNVGMNNTDIRINEQRRQYAEVEARHYRFAQEAVQPHPSGVRNLRILAKPVLVVVLLLGLFMVMTQTIQAHDLVDAGEGDAFSDAMLSYRMGHYHFTVGAYEKAIAEYTSAITAIPQQVFEKRSDYAVMYWNLGNAQLKAGYYEEALTSYQQYLGLNPASDPQETSFVEQLGASIADGTTVEIELMG